MMVESNVKESQAVQQLRERVAQLEQENAALRTRLADNPEKQDLRENEQRLQVLFDYAPDAYYLNDLAGCFVDGNRAAEQTIGYPKDELIGKNFLKLNLLPPSYLPKAAKALALNALGKPTGPEEYLLNRKDGSQVWVEIRTHPVTLRGRCLVLGIARDMTERKQSEKSLRESEEKYRNLFKNSRDAIQISSPDGRFLDANQAWLDMMGYTWEDALNSDWREVYVNPADRKVYREQLERFGAIRDFETRIRIKSGKERIIITSPSVRRNEKGRIVEFQTITRDVTEQRRAEATLRESEEKYRSLFENSRDAIAINTPDGKYLDVNQAWLEMMGYTSEEVSQLNTCDVYVDPADRTTFRQALEKTGSVRDFQVRLRTKGGAERDIVTSTTVRQDADGNAIEYRGTQRDVTDRNRTETELRESEKRYRTLFELSHDAIVMTSPDGQILDANQAWLDMLGYSRSEAKRLQVPSVYAHARDREGFTRALDLNGFLRNHEVELRRQDGAVIVVLCNSWVIRDDAGKIVAYQGIIRDVTEQRRAELELRDSRDQLERRVAERTAKLEEANRYLSTQIEERKRAEAERLLAFDRFESIAKQMPDCFWSSRIDENGVFSVAYVSPGWKRIWGYEPEEIYRTPDIWMKAVLPEDLGIARHVLEQALTTKQPQTGVFRIRSKEGTLRWIEDRMVPIVDESGRAIAMEGIARDITGQKQAERALQQSERELRLITDNLPALIAYVDFDQRYRFVNRRYQESLSLSEDRIVGRKVSEVLEGAIYESIQPKIEKVLAGKRVDFDNEVALPGVGKRFFSASYLPDLGETGKVNGFYVLLNDITDRKRAEAERETHLRHLQALDRVNRLIVSAAEIEDMLRDVLGEILEILHCDRVWLCYPCDPATETVRLPMECTRPEFPGVGNSEVDFPVDEKMQANMRTLLATEEPLDFYGEGISDVLDPEVARQFQVRALMVQAVRPRKGAAWTLGLHQCTHERVWSETDKRFLKDVGRRIEDALTSLLVLRELRESEERFRQHFMYNPVAIYMWQRQGDDFVVRSYNHAAYEDTGDGIEQLVGQTVRGLYEDLPEVIEDVTTCFTEQRPVRKEMLYRYRSTDLERYLDITYIYVPPDYVMVHTEDVTERRRAEQASRKHLEELAHVARLATVGEMATGLAHELNQPLTAIVNYVDVCENKLRSDHTVPIDYLREMVSKIADQSLRAGEIIRGLRSLTKKAPENRKRTQVNTLIREVVELLAPDVRLQKIRIALNLDQSLPEIIGDPIQLQQVIINLLKNACDALAPISPDHREIRIETETIQEGDVRVCVRDNGMGLNDVESERLFDMFFTTKEEGMGMGLAISRSIVEAHGGRLGAEDHPGEGAIFQLILPAAQRDARAEDV